MLEPIPGGPRYPSKRAVIVPIRVLERVADEAIGGLALGGAEFNGVGAARKRELAPESGADELAGSRSSSHDLETPPSDSSHLGHATPLQTHVSLDKAWTWTCTSANWAGLYTQASMWAGHLYLPKQDRFRLTIALGVWRARLAEKGHVLQLYHVEPT